MNRNNLRGIFWFILILNIPLFAQETHNLEIIWQKAGDTTFLSYGFLPTTSGDVNGDGYCDILYYGNERSWAGRAYLFYGGNNIDTIPDAVFSNSNGYDAVCMGDFNGDNFDDIALGNQNGPDGYGRVFIYLGSNPIDTICDFQIRGPHGGSLFGQALSSGDVNGDSYGDLIVGAYGAAPHPGGALMGQVYIYFSGPNFDTIPDIILNGGHQGQYEGFGTTVGSGADVNSDNFDDLIVGAPDFGTGSEGRIYIYFGGQPMDTIYDVAMIGEVPNQSLGWTPKVNLLETELEYDMATFGSAFWPYGFPRVGPGKVYVLFGGNPMDSVPDIWMIGREESTGLGRRVSDAGFVNQTNSEGIISGAPTDYNSLGTAYLWFGGALLDTTPDAWLRGLLNGVGGIGWYVASAGDVDGDGRDEIMVSNYPVAVSPKTVWVCKYTGPGIEENRQPLTAIRLPLEVKPNPAKSQTAIRFSLSTESRISLLIYDITGKLVKTIANQDNILKAGNYEMRWNLRDNNHKKVATGVYFVEVSAEQEEKKMKEIRKITVLK